MRQLELQKATLQQEVVPRPPIDDTVVVVCCSGIAGGRGGEILDMFDVFFILNLAFGSQSLLRAEYRERHVVMAVHFLEVRFFGGGGGVWSFAILQNSKKSRHILFLTVRFPRWPTCRVGNLATHKDAEIRRLHDQLQRQRRETDVRCVRPPPPLVDFPALSFAKARIR